MPGASRVVEVAAVPAPSGLLETGSLSAAVAVAERRCRYDLGVVVVERHWGRELGVVVVELRLPVRGVDMPRPAGDGVHHRIFEKCA